jgi:hypothetical protein
LRIKKFAKRRRELKLRRPRSDSRRKKLREYRLKKNWKRLEPLKLLKTKSKGLKKILQERKERLKRPLLNFKRNKKKQQPLKQKS